MSGRPRDEAAQARGDQQPSLLDIELLQEGRSEGGEVVEGRTCRRKNEREVVPMFSPSRSSGRSDVKSCEGAREAEKGH